MACKELLTTQLEASELSLLPNQVLLSSALALGTVITTPSSFTRCNHENHHENHHERVQIGHGLQGAIFEQATELLVLKKEHPGNSMRPSNLAREHIIHTGVNKAFNQYANQVGCAAVVPQVFSLIRPGSEKWSTIEMAAQFPEQYREGTALMEMERILPLPKVVRKALLARFYLGEDNNTVEDMAMAAAADEMLTDTPNKHCLVRTYLGRKSGKGTREPHFLRNFPLYLDSMLDLELDVAVLADEMGSSFAILHWGAETNGDDVEFVFGTELLPGSSSETLQSRKMGFYLLDFGQCDSVDLSQDVATVYQEFKGAMVTGDNQLFIPNCLTSPSIFEHFRKGYIRAANYILRAKGISQKFDASKFMAEYEEYAEDFL